MEDDICSCGLYACRADDDERWDFYRSEAATLAHDGLMADDYEDC